MLVAPPDYSIAMKHSNRAPWPLTPGGAGGSGGRQEGWIILTEEDMVRGSERKSWYVWFKLYGFNFTLHKAVQCAQRGMISFSEEAFRWHFKAVDLAGILSNISEEMSILVTFFYMSCFNMLFSRAGQLKQMYGFLVVVKNENIWFQCCNTELRGDWSSPWSCVPWKVTIHCEFWIHRVHNIVHNTVVPPGVTTSVKCHLAAFQNRLFGLSTFAKFTQILTILLPAFQISCGRECVNRGIE